MQTYFYVNYQEDEQGNITEISVSLVEGDHIGPLHIFSGPNAVKNLRDWRAEQRPEVNNYSTELSFGNARMERVRQLLGAES